MLFTLVGFLLLETETSSLAAYQKKLVSGNDHACALTLDGVRCWGDESYGITNVPTLNF